MEYLIQQYLFNNNLSGSNGIDYVLQDDGNGAYIKTWNLEISKPSFSVSDYEKAELEKNKILKIEACKAELAKNDWQAAANIKRNRPINSKLTEHEEKIIDLMNQINACVSLKELNAININFE